MERSNDEHDEMTDFPRFPYVRARACATNRKIPSVRHVRHIRPRHPSPWSVAGTVEFSQMYQLPFDEPGVLGWVRMPDGSYVRPDGCDGAPTARIVHTIVSWFCTTWLLRPPRTLFCPEWMAFDIVIDELSISEERGHASRRWLPRPERTPQSTLEGWDCGPFCFYELRRWVRMVGDITLVILEVPSDSGERFVATVNGDVLMRDEQSFQFASPAEAADAALRAALQ